MAVTLIALLQTHHASSDYSSTIGTSIAYAVPYSLTGALLVVRRPDLPFGWILAGAAVVVSVASAVTAFAYLAISRGGSPSLASALLAASAASFLPVVAQGLINVRFPSGRIESRTARVLEASLVVATALGLVAAVFGDRTLDIRRTDGTVAHLHNPIDAHTTFGHVAQGFGVGVPIAILLGLVAGLRVVKRAWRATGIERDQLRWRAFGVVLSIALFPLAFAQSRPGLIEALDGVVFTATLVIPIIRYHLWSIDTVIRRSAGYLLVTVVVASGFAAIAAVVTAIASERVGLVVAAAAAAVAFAPAQSRSQRLVNHLFYGNRDEPHQALSELARRLDTVAAPGEVLSSVVSAVGESLRLPYVAVERPSDASVLACHGDVSLADHAGVERWPLTYQGSPVGVLVASPRRGDLAFDARDRAVLADLARQAGAAVHAEALTADLRDSRQRVVTVAEEERRRLRRDLHDGLGPLLTSLGLNLDAATQHLTAEGDSEAAALIRRAKAASAQAITDLRGIVYGLRPPAIDDLGLAGALTTQLQRLASEGELTISTDISGADNLPAAIEVAVYRVTLEAANNVVRHASASKCGVRIERSGDRLVVEVTDDGRSRAGWRPGVGLHAMKERIAEVGGTIEAGPTTDGGYVRAEIPVASQRDEVAR